MKKWYWVLVFGLALVLGLGLLVGGIMPASAATPVQEEERVSVEELKPPPGPIEVGSGCTGCQWALGEDYLCASCQDPTGFEPVHGVIELGGCWSYRRTEVVDGQEFFCYDYYSYQYLRNRQPPGYVYTCTVPYMDRQEMASCSSTPKSTDWTRCRDPDVPLPSGCGKGVQPVVPNPPDPPASTDGDHPAFNVAAYGPEAGMVVAFFEELKIEDWWSAWPTQCFVVPVDGGWVNATGARGMWASALLSYGTRCQDVRIAGWTGGAWASGSEVIVDEALATAAGPPGSGSPPNTSVCWGSGDWPCPAEARPPTRGDIP